MFHYIGHTAAGRLVRRLSKRDGFRFAAVPKGYDADRDGPANFGPTEKEAAKNFRTSHRGKDPAEVVPVRIVDAAEYNRVAVADWRIACGKARS